MKKITLTSITLGEFTERESKAGKTYKAANCEIQYNGQTRKSLVFYQDYKRLENIHEGNEIYIYEETNGDFKNFKLASEIDIVYEKMKSLYGMITELEKRIGVLEGKKLDIEQGNNELEEADIKTQAINAGLPEDDLPF